MSTLAQIKDAGKLKVGLTLQEGLNGAPWAWMDDQTGLIVGFEADIARALAKKWAVKLSFVPEDKHKLALGLFNNRYDVCISAQKPINKLTGLVYSDPYYALTQRIVTFEEYDVHDLGDLRHKTVGVLTRSLGEYIIEEENKSYTIPIKLKPYQDVVDLFSALHFKDVYAVFIDSPVALWYAKSNINTNLKVVDLAYKSGHYAVMMKEENEGLLESVNEALKEVSFREILGKYGVWDDYQSA